MTRTLRVGILLAAIAVFASFPAFASADGPTAQASRDCSPRTLAQGQSYPPASYVTSIRARNTSCRKAKRVVRAYHDCRGRPRGRCGRRVLRFRCREGNRQSAGVQYSARVVCRRGGRKVIHTYTQNVPS